MRYWAALLILSSACGGSAALDPLFQGDDSSEGDAEPDERRRSGIDDGAPEHSDSGTIDFEPRGDGGELLLSDANVPDGAAIDSGTTAPPCTTCVKLLSIDFDYVTASSTHNRQGFALAGSKLYWAGYSGIYSAATDGTSFKPLKTLPGCNSKQQREFIPFGDTVYFRDLPYDTVNGINGYSPGVRLIRPTQLECELVSGSYGQMGGFFVDSTSVTINAAVRYESQKLFSVTPNGAREVLVDKTYMEVGASDATSWYASDKGTLYRVDRATRTPVLVGTGVGAITGADATWVYGVTASAVVKIAKSSADPYQNKAQVIHTFATSDVHATFFGEEVIYSTGNSIRSVDRAGTVRITSIGDRDAFRVVAGANDYYFVDPLNKIGYGYDFELYRVPR